MLSYCSSVLWPPPTPFLQDYHFTFWAYRYPLYRLSLCRGGSPQFTALSLLTYRSLYAGRFFDADSKFLTSSMAFVHFCGTRLLLFPLARPFWRRGRIHFMLRSANLLALSLRGTFVDTLLRIDFSLRRYPSYGVPWRLPWPDFHRLDNACLAGHARK